MKRSEAFPSRYLSQDDVRAGPIRATIKDLLIETLGQGSDAEEKPTLHFRESHIKPMVLNSGNWGVIEAAYGEDSELWADKPIDIYHDPNVMFGKERKGGIRIRIPGGAVPAQAPASATAPAVVDVMTLEQAIATAIGAGMSKEGFVSAMKLKGLTGYSPSKDTITARAIISEFQFAQNDTTIPF